MSGNWESRGRVRLATLLLPPAGLLLLWRSRDFSVRRKLFSSVAIVLFALPWSALIIFLLIKFGGLQVEFRGGLIPRLTFRKTLPNYAALEANRAAQRNASVATNRASSASTYWNGFRGPLRNGVYAEQAIRTNWPAEGLRPLWKQPVGGGYASFAIAEGLAFTIEQRRENEAIVAYDVATGREAWTNSWLAEFQETLGGDGPRATPAVAGGLVYGLGALGEFRCLKATTGELLWRHNIIDENGGINLAYGLAASPLVASNQVIVVPGGRAGNLVVSYDRLSGKRLWHGQRDQPAYSSPMLMELAGTTHLIVVSDKRAMGLDPADGTLLWQFPWIVLQGNRNIAQPVMIGTNRVFLSGGYGTGCVAFEVTGTAPPYGTRELWRNKFMKNKFTSSVYFEGAICGLDEDLLTCLDARTGARLWKEGRYGYGQVLLAGGQLLVLCGDGDMAVVRANKQRAEQLCRFPGIEGKTWNHPALSGGLLLIRNAAEMACFDLRQESRSAVLSADSNDPTTGIGVK
jgi:outer membrane protein assembly factor BamB